VASSRLSQLAFARDALVFLAGTLDAILELAPIVRELLGHFVAPDGHIAVDDGPNVDDLPDVELMRGHESVPTWSVDWGLLAVIGNKMPPRQTTMMTTRKRKKTRRTKTSSRRS
jgi:hypothetical protein